MSYPLVHSHMLLKRMLKQNPQLRGPAHHLIVLLGETVHCRHDTDREMPFRQESNFAWLSGSCDVPGSALSISYEHEGSEQIDVEKVKTTIYLPEAVPEEVMWSGMPPSPDEICKDVTVTDIQQGWSPVSLISSIKPSNANLQTYIHTLPFLSPPKGVVATVNGPIQTTKYLLPALQEARRIKTAQEMEFLQQANTISSKAHEELMKAVGKGTVQDENAAEAVWWSYCRRNGSKHPAYTPIMAAGASAGTLHYVANDSGFPQTGPGSLLLVDAGCERKNYAADITRCIPIGNGGKFTKECREIYEAVLRMQEEAFAMIRPGADWEAMQRHMHFVLAEELLKLGIFVSKGSPQETIKEIVASGVTSAFYPHGLGHLLGLDVHDVGGLPPEGRSKDPLLRYLRLRFPLEEGFVVTVEPGCYFNEHLFAPFRNSEYVNHDVLSKYWYVGGVRIEDNVIVTASGFHNLTTAAKTVAEVEALTTA